MTRQYLGTRTKTSVMKSLLRPSDAKMNPVDHGGLVGKCVDGRGPEPTFFELQGCHCYTEDHEQWESRQIGIADNNQLAGGPYERRNTGVRHNPLESAWLPARVPFQAVEAIIKP